MTRTNEEQLDLFADLLEPVGEILSDRELAEPLRKGKKLEAIKLGIKRHKQAVIEILALIDGVEVGAYVVPTPPVLALKILALLNNPQVTELFTLQGQNATESASGSATENTEGGAT